MVITKIELQRILDSIQDKIEVEKIFDKILLSANIEQSSDEPEMGHSSGWEAFKTAWVKEDFNQ